MKKLLLLLSICILSINVLAQKITIGVRGGTNYSTAPLGLKSQSIFNAKAVNDASGMRNVLLGLKASLDVKRLQIGIGLDYGKIGYTYKIDFAKTPYTFKYSVQTPFFLPYVFVNLKTSLPNSFIYYGLNAGYMNLETRKNKLAITTNYPQAPGYTYDPYILNNAVVTVGAQVGFTFNIVKGLSFSVESGIRYIPIKAGLEAYDQTLHRYTIGTDKGLLSIPFTSGISYTL